MNYMEKAEEYARLAAALGNRPVGAVLVDNNTGLQVATGCNQVYTRNDATAHAEMMLLRNCKLGRNLRDYTLYVTMEPCLMCMVALSYGKVGKIIYRDPDPMMGASLFDIPTQHKPELIQYTGE